MEMAWKDDIVAKLLKSKNFVNLKPPNPSVKEISQTGSLVLKFDSDIYIVSDPKMLTDGTILLSDVGSNRTLKGRRTLINPKRVPVL